MVAILALQHHIDLQQAVPLLRALVDSKRQQQRTTTTAAKQL